MLRAVEQNHPQRKFIIPWGPSHLSPSFLAAPNTAHAWTDGSFQASSGAGWIITADQLGAGPALTQGKKVLGVQCAAFDSELIAIFFSLREWTTSPRLRHYSSLIIHSGSRSIIAQLQHLRPDPGQSITLDVYNIILQLRRLPVRGLGDAYLIWAKGNAGTPGNERADRLAGSSKSASLSAHLTYCCQIA